MNKTIEYAFCAVMGIFILIVLEFKFIELPELFMMILVFIGFAAIINGVFGFASIIKNDPDLIFKINKKEKNRFCIECGSKIEDNMDFCPDCGHHISSYKENSLKRPIWNPEKDDIKFYDEDDLDTKIDNLSNLAYELREENRQLKEELGKYNKRKKI